MNHLLGTQPVQRANPLHVVERAVTRIRINELITLRRRPLKGGGMNALNLILDQAPHPS